MTGRPEGALFAAPWAVLLIAGLTSAGRGRTLAAVSVDTERVVAGDEIELAIHVQAKSDGWISAIPRPERGFLTGRDGRTGSEIRSTAEVIVADQATTLRCRMPAAEWGSFDVGRVDLTRHEPYGLLHWSGQITARHVVRVHPSPSELRALLQPWLVRRKAGVHESRAVDRGIEYADLRLYGPGDSLRDINWRMSARSDELWVSQRHPERATDVILLLDSLVEAGHDVRSVVGMAIEAVIALAGSHLSLSDRVGLVEVGGVVRWVAPGTGPLQLQRLTDAVLSTRLYSNASERDLEILPPRALPPRSFIVALTPLFDSRFTDNLFALRGAGHDVAVVECEPPPIADSGRADAELRELAIRVWQAERIAIRDRLADNGIAVGRWRAGEPLDTALLDIGQRRVRVRSRQR